MGEAEMMMGFVAGIIIGVLALVAGRVALPARLRRTLGRLLAVAALGLAAAAERLLAVDEPAGRGAEPGAGARAGYAGACGVEWKRMAASHAVAELRAIKGGISALYDRARLFVRPSARWMCGVAALAIAAVRFLSAAVQPVSLLNNLIYVAWFSLAAGGLLLTAGRPHSRRARVAAAIGAGAFVMLAIDVIARSPVSGVIPLVFAYRLAWETLHCEWR